jgi:hypothetical protein
VLTLVELMNRNIGSLRTQVADQKGKLGS